jgi:metal-responsive CopG/Arc/MetJ family transcriptional regulator
VPVNITLPENLVQAIDRASNNRSRFLADAAVERLKTMQPLPGF